MQAMSQIIYRYLTGSDYYNMYKPSGSETTGGGQRYVDFPTSAISVSKWRGFLAGVNGVSETEGENGPRWEVPVFNIQVKTGSQSPVEVAIYQRRSQSVCIANQHIGGNRLPAWQPDTGFPEPADPSARETVPASLAVYLAKTANGEIWAGWFDATTLDSVCQSDDAATQLARMLDHDNEPGSTGFIACREGTLFLNDTDADAPAFLSRNEAQAGVPSRLHLRTLKVTGFKSLKDVCCKFQSLNLLIGANGAGKSNLISALQLAVEALRGRLGGFVQSRGGAKSLLHLGPSATDAIAVGATVLSDEGQSILRQDFGYKPPDSLYLKGQHDEADATAEPQRVAVIDGLCSVIQGQDTLVAPHLVMERFRSEVSILHLLDTSVTAPIRQECYIEDNQRLHPDGGNLAAMMYFFKHSEPKAYKRICSTIRRIVPFFDDFVLEPKRADTNNILLNWKEIGSDYILGPHQISDGSLRVMAIVALLLQPVDSLPDIVVIDEPELGLHPAAKTLIAGLLKKTSHHCQVIVSTQSASLLDSFSAEDVIVVERQEGASSFKRLDEERLREWLEEYTVGQLWEKNVLGGGPF